MDTVNVVVALLMPVVLWMCVVMTRANPPSPDATPKSVEMPHLLGDCYARTSLCIRYCTSVCNGVRSRLHWLAESVPGVCPEDCCACVLQVRKHICVINIASTASMSRL